MSFIYPINKMENYRNHSEYKSAITITSKRAFDDLLAKNLSKRFECLENKMKEKVLDTDLPLKRCYDMVFEDFHDSDKFTTSIFGSKTNAQTKWRKKKLSRNFESIFGTFNKSCDTFEDLLNNDLRNFKSQCMKTCIDQPSITTRSKKCAFAPSCQTKTEGRCIKKHIDSFRKSQIMNNLELSNRRKSSISKQNSCKNISDFRFNQTSVGLINKMNNNQKFQDFNMNIKHFKLKNSIRRICTPIFDNLERLMKHRRKYKPIISENYNCVNSSKGVTKSNELIEGNNSVHLKHIEDMKRCSEPENILQSIKNKDIPAFVERESLQNLPIHGNDFTNIIASLFVPISTEANSMETKPILKNNNSATNEYESEMSNLNSKEQNLGMNIISPITLYNTKKNSSKRNSNSVAFHSHPSKRKTSDNLQYPNAPKVTDSIDAFAMSRSTASRNTIQSHLRATYSTSFELAKGIETMNKSYEIIDLWNYSCPSIECFVTKTNSSRKFIPEIIKTELNDQKLNKKAFVALRRMPAVEEMLKYGMTYSSCPVSINLCSLSVKKKTKNKSFQEIINEKGWYTDSANIDIALIRDYPIVLLTPINVSSLTTKAFRETSIPLSIRDVASSDHACSNHCECFQRDPIVMLTRMDALMHYKLEQKVPNSDNESIIDLTDA